MTRICISLNVVVDTTGDEAEETALTFGENGEGDSVGDYLNRYFRENHPGIDLDEVTVTDAFEVDA